MYHVLSSYDGTNFDEVLKNVSYVEALAFIRCNIRAYERKELRLDIQDVETGRLVSWVLERVS